MEWIDSDKKLLELLQASWVPSQDLRDVPYDTYPFNNVPKEPGCYFIWTTEPVHHTFNSSTQTFEFDGGKVIYNGEASGSLHGRMRDHLMSKYGQDRSGISLDLFKGTPAKYQHYKKAYSKDKCKLPGLIAGHSDLNLTEEETLIRGTQDTVYFRNGIDMRDPKHQGYEFRFYYISGISKAYMSFIEIEWRARYGTPRLCSYHKGR
jgi:hypothetical protein